MTEKINAHSLILKESVVTLEGVKRLKEKGFSVRIMAEHPEKMPVTVISEFAGRINKEEGELCAFTGRSFERLLMSSEKYAEYIDGFILPTPWASQLLWSDEFDKFSAEGELFDIFSEDVKNSRVRVLYYEAVEQYFVENHIEPVYAAAKKIGKEISFDMGEGKIQYDFINGINPIRLACEGYSLTFREYSPEIAAFCKLCGDKCFVLDKNEDMQENISLTGSKILLVKPVRGCRERYVYSPKKRNVRIETPALDASFEGTYYCDKLTEKSMDFLAIDEYTFENSSCVSDGKITLFSQEFHDVIVCKSCLLDERFKNMLKDAEKCGISVNSAEVLEKLSAENWEEI